LTKNKKNHLVSRRVALSMKTVVQMEKKNLDLEAQLIK